VRTWLSTSTPIFVVEGFYLLFTYSDVIVLQQFRPANEVAIYYAAAKTLAMVAFIYYSVAQTIAHKFATYHVTGDRKRLAEFLQLGIRLTFWPSLAAILVFLALGEPLLRLFGRDFVSGYYLMFRSARPSGSSTCSASAAPARSSMPARSRSISRSASR
jgi:O-antigen/teichoic acid export membrane protein